jgi:hypothetical protein
VTTFQVQVDAGQTIRWLDDGMRQLPFATSLAVNTTAKDVQSAIRAEMQASFTIRRPWVLEGVKIPKFSDKSEATPTAIVAIDPSRGFLVKFEPGGVKSASDPNVPIAIPSVNIRPSFAASVPGALYPRALGLVPSRTVAGMRAATGRVTRRGVLQLQGKQRTFVLTGQMFGVQVPGVYQRTGPGPHDFRLLWSYKPSIPIPALLKFQATAQQTVLERWATNFSTAMDRALATAR